MNAILKTTLALAATAIATQAAAQVTFYENEGFNGRSFTVTAQRQVRDFGTDGFNDRAASAVVTGNPWEVCDGAEFGGRCMVLRAGRYPSVAAMGLNDRISSVRSVSPNARISADRYAPAPAVAQINFFEDEGFRGRSLTTKKQLIGFRRSGFDNGVASADVVGERWEVCDETRFRGRCMVLHPGRYPSPASMGLSERVASVRTVSLNTRIDESRYAPAPVVRRDGRDYRRRNEERLYQANVTSARAVVAAAEQRCWMEREQVPQQKSGANIPGAVVGAVLGGILGHQVGSGTTQDVATVGGAAAGGYLGSKVTLGQQASAPQDVQKCASVPSQAPTYWDVTYNFRGQEHRVQMTSQPGPTITVNERGEPRT